MGSPQIQIAAISTLVLFLKCFYSNMMVGKAENLAGKRAPEDFYQKTPESPEALQVALDLLDRNQRICANDLENIPIALIFMWAGAISTVPIVAHLVLCAVYCAARIGHTVTYAMVHSWTHAFALSK
jgi:uncharacterized membrane protein YecN with MAPEG domain